MKLKAGTRTASDKSIMHKFKNYVHIKKSKGKQQKIKKSNRRIRWEDIRMIQGESVQP